MGLGNDVQTALKAGLEGGAASGRSAAEQKQDFMDGIFDLYKHVNAGNPAGVEDGTAEFALNKITMKDVEALKAAGDAEGAATAPPS